MHRLHEYPATTPIILGNFWLRVKSNGMITATRWLRSAVSGRISPAQNNSPCKSNSPPPAPAPRASYRQKVAVKALAREKKLERFLESELIVEKPKPSWQLKLDFAAPETRAALSW